MANTDLRIDPPSRAGTATDPEQVAAILGLDDEPPAFDPDLGPAARRRMIGLVNTLDLDASIYISKRRFADLLHCEAAALAGSSYEVDAGNAAGEIAHLALARLFATPVSQWPELTPTRLVDGAIRHADSETALGAWIAAQEPDEVDGVRAAAVSSVAGLLDVWPAMTDHWLPVPEQELKVGFGRVTVGGRIDLGLFPHRRRSDENHLRSRVLLDWKVGARWPNHDGDVLLYALLQLLRFATPPRMVGTWYLQTGDVHLLELDDDHLRDGLDKLEQAIRVAAELQRGRPPVLRPGPRCKICPLRDACPEAIE